MSVGAHPGVLAFVVIGAISALAGNDEAGRAVASKAAGLIVTDSTLAITQQTLVHIFASAGLPRKSRVALAFVAFLGVDALAVAADIRSQRALVHLGDRLQLRAKPVVIVAAKIGTDEAFVAPSSTHVFAAATILLAQPHRQPILALSVTIYRRVTQSLSAIDAIFPVLALYESRITMAVIAAARVYASSVGANAFLLTLVSVLAFVGLEVPRLSLGTLAHERTGGVDALSALTESGNRIALVDIDALTLLGLQVTLFAIQPSWASFAGVAPTLADSRAAQLPCANHVRKTRQALIVSHFGVTRSGSEIGLATSSGVPVNASATIWTDASSLIQARFSANRFVAKFSLITAATLTPTVHAVSVYAMNSTSTGLAAIAAASGLVRDDFALSIAAGRCDDATFAQANIGLYASP